MIVRDLKQTDIIRAANLLKTYYDEINCEEFHTFNLATVEHNLDSYIESEYAHVIVAEDNRKILGVGGIIIVPSIIDRQDIKALEIIWHSNVNLSTYRRSKVMFKLLTAMERKAKEHGASTLSLGVNHHGGGKDLGDFLTRKNFKLYEHSYIKVVM